MLNVLNVCVSPITVGICDPYDSEACKVMNNWKICQEQEFICPLKEEEGTEQL